MNKLALSYGILGLVLLGTVSVLVANKSANQPVEVSQEQEGEAAASIAPYASQEFQFGQVAVAITPEQLAAGQRVIFRVTLNTHAVDLNYDFSQIAVLEDETGNRYRLLEWTGENGGHHLQGELVFEPLSAKTRQITLSLTGIDDQSREFTWEVRN